MKSSHEVYIQNKGVWNVLNRIKCLAELQTKDEFSNIAIDRNEAQALMKYIKELHNELDMGIHECYSTACEAYFIGLNDKAGQLKQTA